MSGLPHRLVEFVGALREHGIPVGTGETVDAAAAVDVLGLADRERLRAALAATVLRGTGLRATFDALFDLYFPVAVGRAETTVDTAELPALRDALVAALAAGDTARMRALAAAGVAAYGRFGTIGGGTGGWSAYHTLNRIRPDDLFARVRAAIQGEEDGGLADAIAQQEAHSRIAQLREYIQSEARRRTSELRGRDHIARYAVAPPSDQASFVGARSEQLTELRRTIQPLSRKLATRLAARRRRAHRGQIDMRRTLRRSLATGGVPMRPVLRRRRPGRPELVLLCDMSGSVAGFAQFTLELVQALADQFSKVRTFAFIELTDDITDLVTAAATDTRNLAERIATEARLTRWARSSDYGSSLAGFVDGWLDAVGPRTSVLILGDGRTNGGDANLSAVRRIADQARHVYWLNPEPRSLWATGDSAALLYARLVPMYECRNLRQLSRLVTELLPD
ncbi:VWA domain-containing protein [Streptomyces sp. NPDC051677]|uniref:VWA domain-containing protein n=1 Tax=Streptomyces sp. NPDC051677 TaxID=3365669 RepID=UPI0037CE06AB